MQEIIIIITGEGADSVGARLFFWFFLFLLGEGADSGGARRPAQQFRDSDAGNSKFFLI